MPKKTASQPKAGRRSFNFYDFDERWNATTSGFP